MNSIVKNWIFTDLLESLHLILKNVNSNHCTNTEIVELDWLDPHYTPTEPPDFIFSIDGIYNPALSLPLAKTIDLCAGDNTIVLILAELREPEALEIFLEEMRKLKFKIRRVIFDESDELNGQFVLWIASKLELNFVN